MMDEDVRINKLATGATKDLLILLAGQINRKEMEVLAVTVETCQKTGIKTLSITYKHSDDPRGSSC